MVRDYGQDWGAGESAGTFPSSKLTQSKSSMG